MWSDLRKQCAIRDSNPEPADKEAGYFPLLLAGRFSFFEMPVDLR